MPHRLYGHVDAAENFSVGRWCEEAAAALAATQRASRAAIIVGGTGLYFNALTRGLAAVPPIPAKIRDEVRARLASDGVAALHAELEWRDPAAAARLMPGDRARITRALEVVLATGRSLLEWHEENKPPSLDPARAAKIFLMPERDELLRRIDARFDAMMAAGAIEEVRALAARNLDPDLPAMKAHGVPWLIRHLNGEITLAEAVEGVEARHPPIHQAPGNVVPQPAAGFRLGRAATGACCDRSAVADHVVRWARRAVGLVPRGQNRARAVPTRKGLSGRFCPPYALSRFAGQDEARYRCDMYCSPAE